MLTSKLRWFLIMVAIAVIFLLPIVKYNPYLSVALWFIGLGVIIMAFIQSLLNQIKFTRMH